MCPLPRRQKIWEAPRAAGEAALCSEHKLSRRLRRCEAEVDRADMEDVADRCPALASRSYHHRREWSRSEILMDARRVMVSPAVMDKLWVHLRRLRDLGMD